MSIQNILVDNNLSLFCENLQVDKQITNSWGNVPGLDIINHSVPFYYNSVLLTNLSCTFIRITSGIQPGLCYMLIPSYTLPSTAAASQFYLDISSFSDILINSSSSISSPYLVQNDGNLTVGMVTCDGSVQHIIFSGGPDTATHFNIGGNPSGLTYPGYIIYEQAFA